MLEVVKDDVKKKEKLISELKCNPKENVKHINSLLVNIRNDYKKIIIECVKDMDEAELRENRDIFSSLWKTCFYQQIEEYRRSIKKTKCILDEKPRSTHYVKAVAHLSDLVTAFSKFIYASILWYQELLLQVENSVKKVDYASDMGRYYQYIICRCLIYLGDLSRYRSLHVDANDYSEAERYYKRASFIYPNLGHPHNQLAVISIYHSDIFNAAYHYYRCFICSEPFNIGYSSLLSTLSRVEDSVQATNSSLTNTSRRKKDNGGSWKVFISRFFKILGCIHRLNETLEHSADATQFDEESINALIESISQCLKSFEELLPSYLSQSSASAPSAISASVSPHSSPTPYHYFLRDVALLRIVVCLVSCIESLRKGRSTQYRDLVESISTTFLLSLTNRMVLTVESHIRDKTSQYTRKQQTFVLDKAHLSTLARFLSAIHVVVVWANQHPYYLYNSHKAVPEAERSTLVMDSIRSENRVKSACRSSLSSLLALPWSTLLPDASSRTELKFPLREFVELRGWQPISDHIEEMLKPLLTSAKTNGYSDVFSSQTTPSDDQSYLHIEFRLNVVRQVLQSLPTAAMPRSLILGSSNDKPSRSVKKGEKEDMNKNKTVLMGTDDDDSLDNISSLISELCRPSPSSLHPEASDPVGKLTDASDWSRNDADVSLSFGEDGDSFGEDDVVLFQPSYPLRKPVSQAEIFTTPLPGDLEISTPCGIRTVPSTNDIFSIIHDVEVSPSRSFDILNFKDFPSNGEVSKSSPMFLATPERPGSSDISNIHSMFDISAASNAPKQLSMTDLRLDGNGDGHFLEANPLQYGMLNDRADGFYLPYPHNSSVFPYQKTESSLSVAYMSDERDYDASSSFNIADIIPPPGLSKPSSSSSTSNPYNNSTNRWI